MVKLKNVYFSYLSCSNFLLINSRTALTNAKILKENSPHVGPHTGLAAYMGVSSDNTLTPTFSVVPPNKRLWRRKNCEKQKN